MLAIAANAWWGLSPIFWKQLSGEVAPLDTVAIRVSLTALLLIAAQSLRRNWPAVKALAADRRNLALMAVSASLLFANWAVFLWAVEQERVTEASLGYFVVPLFSVLLGAVILQERMRAAQWAAVGLAAVGVAWLTIDLGAVPVVAVTLAVTFALYGLLRKRSPAGSLDGLTFEAGFLAPLCLGFLALRGGTGTELVDVANGRVLFFLALTGVVTAVPLLLFAAAAREVPLTFLGVVQYVNPTLQFLVGVVLYDEAFDGGQLLGYSVIWVALAVFAIEGLMHARRSPDATPVPVAAPR